MKDYELDERVAMLFDAAADQVHNVADSTLKAPQLTNQTKALYELADELRNSADRLRELADSRQAKQLRSGIGYTTMIYIHFAIYILAGWKLFSIVLGWFA